MNLKIAMVYEVVSLQSVKVISVGVVSEAVDPYSGVTTAPATPAVQGGGTLGGRHITELTVFFNEKSFDKVAKCTISRPT